MSADFTSDTPVVLATPAQIAADELSARTEWVDTALTVLFTATAVLFVSFLAVVTGLV